MKLTHATLLQPYSRSYSKIDKKPLIHWQTTNSTDECYCIFTFSRYKQTYGYYYALETTEMEIF